MNTVVTNFLMDYHLSLCHPCQQFVKKSAISVCTRYPESDYIFTSPLLPIVFSRVDFSYGLLTGLLFFKLCHSHTWSILNRARMMLS